MWRLEGELNGRYFAEEWQTQERAIQRREQRLEPVRNKKGFMVHPTGWTGIKYYADRVGHTSFKDIRRTKPVFES